MDNYTLLQQASQFAESGQFDRARQLVIQAIKNNGQDSEAWWALAQVARTDNERRRAIDEVLRLDPHHMHALHMRDQVRAGSLDSVEYPGKVGGHKAATNEDFMPKVAVTLIAYFVMYFIGILLNIYFLHDANKFQRVHGYKPQNMGCLWAMLVVFLIAPLGMCVAAFGLMLVANTLSGF